MIIGKLCDERASCKHWTWISPQVKREDLKPYAKKCHLKNEHVNDGILSFGLISGETGCNEKKGK